MEREEFGPDHRTALKFGGQKINLRPDRRRSRAPGSPAPATPPGAADLCFITAVGAEDDASPTCTASAWRSRRPGARGPARLVPMRSVYCRDPDGNLIEIASYLTA